MLAERVFFKFLRLIADSCGRRQSDQVSGLVAMASALSSIFAELSLSHLSTEPVAAESIESLISELTDDWSSRPALLRRLARGGVSKLAERQKLANQLSRLRKAQQQTDSKDVPQQLSDAAPVSLPKTWAKGTAEDYMAAMHLMAKQANDDVRDKHGVRNESSAEFSVRLQRALVSGKVSQASATSCGRGWHRKRAAAAARLRACARC